jgi:hypothetical protein
MNRRKAVAVGVAAFAIGAAFAAQPVSVRADRGSLIERRSWVPGTNGVMAAYETSALPAAPPQ